MNSDQDPPWPSLLRLPIRGTKRVQIPNNVRNSKQDARYKAVLRSQIRIRRFFGFLNQDPLVRGTDPNPSIIKQKY
jgi:hypothetical protein